MHNVAARPGAGEQAALPSMLRIGESDVALWPDGQRIEPLSAPLMASTHFDDHRHYHGDLAATILEMERDPARRDWIFKGGCGMKVRRPDCWGRAAADLIHGRALSLAYRVLSQATSLPTIAGPASIAMASTACRTATCARM